VWGVLLGGVEEGDDLRRLGDRDLVLVGDLSLDGDLRTPEVRVKVPMVPEHALGVGKPHLDPPVCKAPIRVPSLPLHGSPATAWLLAFRGRFATAAAKPPGAKLRGHDIGQVRATAVLDEPLDRGARGR
jgi:hypothetical protein